MCPFISNKDHAQFDIKPGNHNNRLENKFEGKKSVSKLDHNSNVTVSEITQFTSNSMTFDIRIILTFEGRTSDIRMSNIEMIQMSNFKLYDECRNAMNIEHQTV